MEQQVAEASLAMVRPTTDSATRAAASNFLEQWTRRPEAWHVYNKWLLSFHVTDTSAEVVGTQLLCLTLLQAKIRREVPRGTNNALLRPIQNQLLSLTTDASPPILRPLCVCTAALAVRCGGLQDVVSMCQSATFITPLVALRILACLPPEVEACQDLTTPQVTETLWPYVEGVLDTVRRALAFPDTIQPALEALQNWAQTCNVTLSHLNSPTCGGAESLLPLLIQILSQPQPADVLVSASRALTEAIIVPTDTCTPAREEAVAAMVHAFSNGFVAAPFCSCIENDDACHALSTLVGTLVTEEVDYVATQPAEPLLHLLFQLQSHPCIPVTIPVLECWLTVQEVPTSSRHEHWNAVLFRKVLEGLMVRIAYPSSFLGWEHEVELDAQEFLELRRMVTDVLISCYFLLRVEFLQTMSMQSQDWTGTESALYCLCCVSREVCARVKASRGGEALRADRDATSQQLLQLVQHYIGPSSNVHPLVRRGIASFIGSYAPAWNALCSPEAILQLLAYLLTGSLTEEAAKATRSVSVGCASKLVDGNDHGALLSSVRESMDAVLSTDDEASMAAVAEGNTRLVVQIKDRYLVRQSLTNIIVAPLMQRADAAVNIVVAQTPQSESAVLALAKYLHILQVVIRFCDVASHNGDAHILSDAVASLWPFLDKTAQQCGQYEDVLNEVLTVHGQLLNTVPDLVSAHFSATVKFVVEAFERIKVPSALDYIAGAVEAFSPLEEASKELFKELLRHVSAVTVAYVTTEKRPDECPQLIRAFFEMNQRFMLFCPSALIGCQEFPIIISFAVECLTACHGERESVRASLIFLSQLFGWKSLRLSQASTEGLEGMARKIDEQLLLHGEAVIRACIDGLSGGPQMLWPALSDCVFAITTHVAGNNAAGPVVEENTVAHQWVYSSLSNCTATKGEAMKPETCQQIMAILFELSRQGQKSKPKAKMLLTDFGKICKGEMTTDALLTYALK